MTISHHHLHLLHPFFHLLLLLLITITTTIIIIITIITIGMDVIAGRLSEPFGNDLVDFPVHTWLSKCWDSTLGILNKTDEARSVCYSSKD